MKILALLFFLSILSPELIIFDFNNNCSLTKWRIVDDVVMGGKSAGSFIINDSGHGEFSGVVSLDNNGGFSSVRYRFEAINVQDFSKIIIRLKGDGKRYQFRVKSDQNMRQSYIAYFESSGDWQSIEIKMDDLFPSWRGMRLDMPNFPGIAIEELAFLISNKKAESFKLEIDYISLQ